MRGVLVNCAGRVSRQNDIRMGREMIAGSWMVRNRCLKSGVERGWRQVTFCLIRQRVEHVDRHWE